MKNKKKNKNEFVRRWKQEEWWILEALGLVASREALGCSNGPWFSVSKHGAVVSFFLENCDFTVALCELMYLCCLMCYYAYYSRIRC